ncbi:MAG TPA: excinuclease ABC subunit UvrC [Chitinophagales bacterium]|nr:excinuclease ABC subunit UvrC [Chitinophagales bacterium]HMZ33874.1 excinuclease ABC subunit UvrC [Chitinophagales bacterium]HNA38201.1 excinuclease ABC subunit UvrC [Chitinophagales bacterium]HNB49215.1 excinuclease ABC subunit UvrC [Chitinophagales bacterium]HNC71694.1 excinuclease ABC subunit UvrC [Chitinophagales bacterium]
MSNFETLHTIIKNLPKNPGVYRYYDIDGNLLYIGKAKNLKSRVSSYFVNKDHSFRIQIMVKKIHNIEYSIVPTEKDALLLENALIKEHQPKYNILLKDDKSFPYIKILNEPFPRIFFTRKYEQDGAEYYGPYTSVNQVRSILELIKKLYPIRNCSLSLTEKNIKAKKFKVCLEYHIGNCLAPCVGFQSKENYDNNIAQIRKIVKGRLHEVRQTLKEQMQSYAEQMEFEKAELIKIKFHSLKEYISVSTVVNPSLGNFHIFGFAEDAQKAYINYLCVYEGSIIRTKAITLQKKLDETKEELLNFAINDILSELKEKENILLPFELENENEQIQILVPKIGEKKKLIELAQRNAIFQLQKGKEKPKIDNTTRVLALMKDELKLNKIPRHIECFDNSNFQGTNAVSACVVFKNAKPSKKDYRHFNVKTVIGANDFDTMKEVVYRRYHRMILEKEALPDLVVIDGGKGQLSAAMESIMNLQLEDELQVISIAKRLEEIYYPNDPIPLHINKKSDTLKVLQHIRNEAHRFGITFHRNKRDKNTLSTELQTIAGIGEATATELLRIFGSIKRIKQTEKIELEKAIGKAKAKLVFDYYHK